MKMHAWTNGPGGVFCMDCNRSGPELGEKNDAWVSECRGGRRPLDIEAIRAKMPPQHAAWSRVQVAVGFAWDACPTFAEVALRVEEICGGRAVNSKADPATENLQAEVKRLRQYAANLNNECETHAARVRQLERERELERGPGLKPEPAPVTCDIGAYYDE